MPAAPSTAANLPPNSVLATRASLIRERIPAAHVPRDPSEEMVHGPAPSVRGNLEDLGQFAGCPRFAGRPAEPSRWTDQAEVADRHLRADRQRRLWQRLPRAWRNL